MEPANYEDPEEMEFDELEVDGRSLSEGTIATLLAASQFDGNGFIVSVDCQQSLNSSETKESQPVTAQINEESSETCAQHQSGDEVSPSNDQALQRAYKDVVRNLKRQRESRTPSRNVSSEDARTAAQEEAINSFFAQVDLEDALEALESGLCAEAIGEEDEADTYLPPSEEPLKPHLGDIHVRIEPDTSSSGGRTVLRIQPTTNAAEEALLEHQQVGILYRGMARPAGTPPRPAERGIGGAAQAEAAPGSPAPPLAWEDAPGSLVPQPSSFTVSGIGTAVCHLFPPHLAPGPGPPDRVLDVELLAAYCPIGPVPGWLGPGQILEARSANDLQVADRRDADGADLDRRDSQRRVDKSKVHKVCTVRMSLPGGGDKVTLKVWQGGKTQACGCKSVEMVQAANWLMQAAICHAHDAAPRPVIIASGLGVAGPGTREVAVEKLSIQGKWSCNFDAIGVRLRLPELCVYLRDTWPLLIARAELAGQGESAAARFGQINLYVRRAGLNCDEAGPAGLPALVGATAGVGCAGKEGKERKERKDTKEAKEIYVRLYRDGKCCVNGVESVAMGEMLAWRVSEALCAACTVQHLREPDAPAAARPKKRR